MTAVLFVTALRPLARKESDSQPPRTGQLDRLQPVQPLSLSYIYCLDPIPLPRRRAALSALPKATNAAVSRAIGSSSVMASVDRIKGPWSPEEDEALQRLVDNYGPRNWTLISKSIPGRSGKSCRLRWCNQLSPQVERRPFSAEEDDTIVRAHAEFGNKWATIARLLNGRTDNAVKNHWNSTLKRKCSSSVAGGYDGDLPQKPLKRSASLCSGSGTDLFPSSPTGSDLSDSGLGMSPPTHVFLPFARTGPIFPLTINPVDAKPPPPPPVVDPMTSLSLCPPGFEPRESLARTSSGPELKPVVSERPGHRYSESADGVDKQFFSEEFMSVMQDMIRKEIRSYMTGVQQPFGDGGSGGGLCFQSDAVRNVAVKRVGVGRIE